MHPIKPVRPITIFILITTLLSACSPKNPPAAAPTATPTRQAEEERDFQPIMIDTVSYAPGQAEDGLYLAAGVDVDTELVIPEGFAQQAIRSGNGTVLPAEDGNDAPDSFIQFQVGDGILYQGLPTKWVSVEIEYLDEGTDSFGLEYDSFAGAFTALETVNKTDSGEIRTAAFLLCDAYFANRTNQADFRILDYGDGPETIFSVTVRLQPDLDDETFIKAGSCTFNPDRNQPDTQENPLPQE